MNRYKLQALSSFKRDYKKFRKDKNTLNKIDDVLELLLTDPFINKLQTHKVNPPSIGEAWSSKVTGDLRILWVFSASQDLIIVVIRLQGHDTVYN